VDDRNTPAPPSQQALQGVASLGVRPTVHEDGKPVLEVYLFGFDQDIYGRHLRVHFLHKLRDEKKYPDLPTLTQQIDQDVRDAQKYFSPLSLSSSAKGEKKLPGRLN
jgi:riboflavin kinase/FMN adenylyltransferase